MSRLHRAVEKADREGLLTWTRSVEESRDAPAEPPAPRAVAPPERSPVEPPPPAPAVEAAAQPFRAARAAPQWAGAADAGVAFEDAEREPPGESAEPSLSPLLVAYTEPASTAAEQYRVLRTRIEARDGAHRTQLLLVTSPRIGEGKTTTSANLALTMAREFHHRVLLVEADLRRPSLASRFGIHVEHGLVDVLVGALPLEDALVPLPGHQLTLLPAGAEAAQSTELLASSMMHQVVETLRSRFDRIIVDTPPVVLSDTHVLARMADGILIVVRAGQTPRPALERALESIDRARLLGIVLNEVEEATDAYSYPGLAYAGTSAP